MADIFGGGGQRSVSTTQQGAPQPLPQLSEYLTRVGQIGRQALDFPELSLSRFAQDQPLPVPGLSPLEQAARGLVAQRVSTGIPTPPAEQLAFGRAAELPGLSILPHPFEAQGIQAAQRFVGPDFGQSPAVKAAVTGLEQQIVPRIQNELARAGVAQSTLPSEFILQAYARELVPLFSQGLAQEQQAAGQLLGAGQAMAGRGVQTALGLSPELRAIGATQQQRPMQEIREALDMGQRERDIEQARAQSAMQSFLRQREMAIGLMGPLGLTSSAGPATVRVESQTKPSGTFGLFKIFVLALIPALGRLL